MASFNFPVSGLTRRPGNRVFDPRQIYAQALISNGIDTSPVQSPWQGLARLASTGVGAYLANQVQGDEKAKQEAYVKALMEGVEAGQGKPAETKTYSRMMGDDGQMVDSPTTINWDPVKPDTNRMVSLWASNPDTAPLAAEFQTNQLQARQQAELRKQDKVGTTREIKRGSDIITQQFDGTNWVDFSTAPRAEAAPRKQGDTRSFKQGDQEVTEEWTGTEWRRLGAGAAFKPEAGAGAYRLATPEEMKAAGLKPGTVAQMGPNGKIDVIYAPKDEQGGTFGGTGLEAQMLNVVARYQQKRANGQATTPQEDYEFALAQRHLEAPTVVGTPETGFTQVNKPPLPPYPGASPGTPSPVPPPTQEQIASMERPDPAMGGRFEEFGVNTAQPAPGQASVTAITEAPGASKAEREKFANAVAEANTLKAQLDEFGNAFKTAGVLERGKSMLGANTPLNTKFNVAALLSKGEQLFNLGVLNGPDLDIIRRTLPDPSTPMSALVTDKDMAGALKTVTDLIRRRVAEKAKALKLPMPEGYELEAPETDAPATEPPPGFIIIPRAAAGQMR